MALSETQSSMFSTCGSMARPAGVASIMASDPKQPIESIFFGQSLPKGTVGQIHALQTSNQCAEMIPPGWEKKEPPVKPTQSYHGAGVVNAGTIDNTYTPAPLKNRWGKARELSAREVRVAPHKQCSDLLAVAKGAVMPPPAMDLKGIDSVRPTYSKTIPLLHPIDPQRNESGFVRGPNVIPGAKPAPRFTVDGKVKELPEDWRLRKLEYCRGAGDMRISNSRVVMTGAERPESPAPRFLVKPAGLPGGLSIIE